MQSLTRVGRAAAATSSCSHQQRLSAPLSRGRADVARGQRLVVAKDAAASKQQSVEDVLAAANALLNNLQGGEVQASSPSVVASIEELQGLGYVCDESGCVLVLPGQQDRSEGQQAPITGLLSGKDWSLGMLEEVPEPDEGEAPTPYTAVIAGPAWSIPLKPSELSGVVSMLTQLRLMVANLNAQGQWSAGSSDRPASRVKRETSHIVMVAAYTPADPGFSLEMTFKSSSRSVTTYWPAEVVAAVITAVDKALGTTNPNSTGRLERVSTTATVSA